MAIEQRIVNNSLTEIYVIGGGNFITQSQPTNFHHFFTRKILTPTEDISDFREVTDELFAQAAAKNITIATT